MTLKPLHELLNEDQEPFHLQDYIALRKPQKPPQLPKKCKNTPRYPNCFLSLQYSPDIRNSPLISVKSPKSVPVHLQVPAGTAALLFEAAIRIQTQKKTRNQIKNIGFNLFGSILKKLGTKNRTAKRELGNEVGGSEINLNKRDVSAISCSCENSAVWSQSNENNSISTQFDDSEDFGAMSPFRFALQLSPSPTHRTPVFSPIAKSPSPRKIQERENLKSDEEDEKEQFSPVSVLDPPFEDEEGIGNDMDDYDIECNYEFVQRPKKQLLHKLCRFEKLTELDPIELEKSMLDEEDKEGLKDDYQETKFDAFVNDVLGQVDISRDMKKLIFDLVNEENKKECNDDVAKMVRRKLNSWNEVRLNTIDMMIECDFRGETEEWKGNGKDEVAKIVSEIEDAIFGDVIEESEELF